RDDTWALLGSHPEWVTVALSSPVGERLLTATQPYGNSSTTVSDAESVIGVAQSQRPRVGSLHGGPGSLQFHFPIRVPVLRDGATKYVLTAVIAASAIGQLLDDQRLPSGWIAAILDAKGTIVARTTALDRIVGQPAGTLTPPRDFPGRSTWIRRDMGGQPGYVTYARSPQSDWTVAI